MGEKYGVAADQSFQEVHPCSTYEEAVRAAARGDLIVVFYSHGRWWF
jgi:hypothetical protein